MNYFILRFHTRYLFMRIYMHSNKLYSNKNKKNFLEFLNKKQTLTQICRFIVDFNLLFILRKFKYERKHVHREKKIYNKSFVKIEKRHSRNHKISSNIFKIFQTSNEQIVA